MIMLTKQYVENKVKNAIKKGYYSARIRKTGDQDVDTAVMQTVEEWGYKVAQSPHYIMVLL
ncbi:hypothetical protein [Megasphaera massiliensis]|uniref:hypothetical protein n=1 Tax=Megasphaera massiliensis TaxID=1232428 RepID=UPI0005C8DFC4|nr:hypothetical protein [Megasphaera massiliensis]